MVRGKIRPAGQARQRLPASQAMIRARCAGVKVRGMSCWTIPSPDRASPAKPSTRPASLSPRRSLPGRARDPRPSSRGPARPGSAAPAGPPGPHGPGTCHGSCHPIPGPPPLSGTSGRIATRECYGLATPGGRPVHRALPWMPETAIAAREASVCGQGRIYLFDPGQHPATDMYRVCKACIFDHRKTFR
jgi:hypothetical protein